MSVDTAAAPVDAEARLKAYYGKFDSEREKEALSVPLRLVAAWAKNDAAAVAEVCTEDATMILPGDVYKRGREEIQSFLAAAFAGPFRGTGVTGRPVDLRFVTDNVAIIRTHGGILAPGETEIEPELAVLSCWVAVKDNGNWMLAAYQNSPRGEGATLRW